MNPRKIHNDGKGVWIGGMRCMDRRDELMREHVACRRRSDETRVDRSLSLFMITCKTSPSVDSRIIAHKALRLCDTSSNNRYIAYIQHLRIMIL